MCSWNSPEDLFFGFLAEVVILVSRIFRFMSSLVIFPKLRPMELWFYKMLQGMEALHNPDPLWDPLCILYVSYLKALSFSEKTTMGK